MYCWEIKRQQTSLNGRELFVF